MTVARAGAAPKALLIETLKHGRFRGAWAADEDIHFFDGSKFSWIFDGSDLGLAATAVDAFAVPGENIVLLSFRDQISLPGISETVDDSDPNAVDMLMRNVLHHVARVRFDVG